MPGTKAVILSNGDAECDSGELPSRKAALRDSFKGDPHSWT